VTLPQNSAVSEVRIEFTPRRRISSLARTEAKAKLETLGKALKRLAQASWEWVGCFVYLCRGRLPLTAGYSEYRDRYVRRIIGKGEILQVFGAGQELPEGFGARLDERVVEYPWLLSRLGRYGEKSRVLDAGSTLNHESILQHPAVKAHKLSILTLSPETKCFWDLGVSYIYDDLRSLPFKDEWFDAITCVSVIEHVGMDNVFFAVEKAYRENRPQDYLRAVQEMRRILRPGGSLFLTVPFGRYEHHGWFQQFDSGMLSALISEFGPRKVGKTFFRYTDRGWRLAGEAECSDLSFSDAIRNKHFMDKGRARRFDFDYAVAARGVACLELQK
jgi:SAM-dependent methyltransferase